MPLVRITCPAELTPAAIEFLAELGFVRDVTVSIGARIDPAGDLILADLPRANVDDVLEWIAGTPHLPEVHVSLQPSEALLGADAPESDDEAVVWGQVFRDVHQAGRLSWVNVSLIVIAAMIAAVGLLDDQPLLIVGAMALSPDYYIVADTSLSIVRRRWGQAWTAILSATTCFGLGIVGAWALTELLNAIGVVDPGAETARQFTLFVSRPSATSVVVALLAGVAGAIGLTLSDSRGLVGVFVSITTIPAAADMGVAIAARDVDQFAGAFLQLVVNLTSLLIAGTITLAIRFHFRDRRPLSVTPPGR